MYGVPYNIATSNNHTHIYLGSTHSGLLLEHQWVTQLLEGSLGLAERSGGRLELLFNEFRGVEVFARVTGTLVLKRIGWVRGRRFGVKEDRGRGVRVRDEAGSWG